MGFISSTGFNSAITHMQTVHPMEKRIHNWAAHLTTTANSRLNSSNQEGDLCPTAIACTLRCYLLCFSSLQITMCAHSYQLSFLIWLHDGTINWFWPHWHWCLMPQFLPFWIGKANCPRSVIQKYKLTFTPTQWHFPGNARAAQTQQFILTRPYHGKAVC